MNNILRIFAIGLLAGGLMLAGEPGKTLSVELRDKPLAEAVQQVEKETGRKIDALPALLAGKSVTFVSRGTAEEILAAFNTTLEKSQSLTMIRSENGSFRVHGFIPAKPASIRPASRGRRLSVDVIEGTVALVGDRGRVTVRSGERSFVAAGAVPAQPVPCDPSTVATWRFPDAPAAAGIDASIPLPEIRWRFVGTTEDGKPIVEYEIVGDSRTTDLGTFEASTVARHRLVIENGVLDLPINFHFTVDKGTNK
ncbi:MAG: hypothetical protein K8T20_15635 [Planctomycetes bacterium]|nr:hypothetical protein [Planctomycetota bacterium]